ncbi:hypothetical protein BH10PSE4_BH10PSE4_30150 [soil metagenome]
MPGVPEERAFDPSWEPPSRLADLSDHRLDPARIAARAQRLAAATALVNDEARSRRDVEEAADLLGLSLPTVYRDMRAVREGCTEARDLKGRGGYPAGRSRLHPRVEEIIRTYLLRHHLVPAKPSVKDSWEKIGALCLAEGYGEPSRASIISRLEAIPLNVRLRRRIGKNAAEAKTPRPGKYVVQQPWEIWQIDHTLADVIVVDAVHRKPIGRPWLTLVMDVATRMVAGFYVSLQPPSLIRAAVAMDLAVQDKRAWLDDKRMAHVQAWPISGLPRWVHSDRASEFRSPWFINALANQNTQTILRPSGRTRYGGHIERIIGAFMGKCRLLPGATHNSPATRGDYDSKSAARLTLDELQHWFAEQILGVYHNTAHMGLAGATPLQAWTAATAGLSPRMPANPQNFRFDLFPGVTRILGRQGIRLFNEDYCSSELIDAYLRGERSVVVKYDPRSLARIYVKVAKDRFVIVPLSRPNGEDRPLWLYHASRRIAAATGQRWDPLRARQAQRRAEVVIQQAAAKTDRARRQADRLRDDRIATAAPIIKAPPIDDDEGDWGLNP